MVIQEGKRSAESEGVEPEGEFSKLHSHGVKVHAIDTALHHHPFDQVSGRQFVLIDLYALFLKVGKDCGAEIIDFFKNGVLRILDQKFDDVVRQAIDSFHKEMAATHSWIKDFYGKKLIKSLLFLNVEFLVEEPFFRARSTR